MASRNWMGTGLGFFIALLVAACGGGSGAGGDSSPALAGSPSEATPASPAPQPNANAWVQFDPPLIADTFVELGQGFPRGDVSLPAGQRVTVTFKQPPDGPVYLVVGQEHPLFEGTPLQPTSTQNTYSMYLPYSRRLEAGSYKGRLTFMFCGDPACNSQYEGSGAVLPYDLTLTPGIHLSVTVNGKPASGGVISVRSGDVLNIASNVPVSWDIPWTSGGMAADKVWTDRTWTARAIYAQTSGGPDASFDLYAGSQALGAAVVIDFQIKE